MLWLRRGWLCAVGCALLLACAGALIMRFDLVDPEPTLSPSLFNHAFTLHGLMSLGVLIGVVLAIPTFVVKPGRGAATLGSVALGLWAAAIALLVSLELRGAPEWAGFSPRSVLLVFAASLALGAAQIVVSLPVNTRPQFVAAVGAIAAIAIAITPLLAREFPTALYWTIVATIIACALIPDAMERGARSFAFIAIAPSVLLAWAATVLVRVVHTSYLHDTVAMLSPVPVTGAALLNALLVAAHRSRPPHHWLLGAASGLITVGASLTSLGFFVLGSRGLPRRYLAYLPEYQPMQILVGAAAVVGAIGAVAALAACRRGAASIES